MKSTHLRRGSFFALPLAATLLCAACGPSESTATDTTADPGVEAVSTDEVTEPADDDTPVTEVAESTGTDTTAAGDGDSATAVGYLGSYSLADEEFGTMVTVTVDGDTRTIEANALPDHETGEFPNDGNPNTISEQDATYTYTTGPTFVGNATQSLTTGVAVNGVKFEPGTAETVTCESGETLRVEALQDVYNLGLDFNNAHVQPTGEYHYHGVSALLVDAYATDDDLVHVGFAADGFLMYYSKSGAYESGYELSTDTRSGTECVASGPAGGSTVEIEGTTPDGTYSSDWVHSDDTGDLDECNGITIDGGYVYLITDEYPYVSRCLNGEVTGGGPGAGGAPPGGQAPGAGHGTETGGLPGAGQIDLSDAAAALGVSENELIAALGAPPLDLDAAAATLGISVEELRAVLPGPPGAAPGQS